jgi:hypothetical protein
MRVYEGESQWPLGLKHEASLSNSGIVCADPTSSMHVCVYYVFVLSCVQVAVLRWADPFQRVLRTLCNIICISCILFCHDLWYSGRQ